MPCPFRVPSFDKNNNIQWGVRMTKSSFMQFIPLSSNLLSIRPKHSPQYLKLNMPQIYFLLKVRQQGSHKLKYSFIHYNWICAKSERAVGSNASDLYSESTCFEPQLEWGLSCTVFQVFISLSVLMRVSLCNHRFTF